MYMKIVPKPLEASNLILIQYVLTYSVDNIIVNCRVKYNYKVMAAYTRVSINRYTKVSRS